MNKEWLRHFCLYAFGCKEWQGIEDKIIEFIEHLNEHNILEIESAVKRTPALCCIDLIAKSNGFDYIDFLNRDISRAYWLGDGGLLKPVTREDINAIIQKYKDEKYVHQLRLWKIEKLIGKRPFHNVAVLQDLEGVKKISHLPVEVIAMTNDCLVLPGRISLIDHRGYLGISTFSLTVAENTFFLQESQKQIKTGFIKNPKVGMIISVHLGIGREKISADTAEGLVRTTNEAITLYQRGCK